MNLKSGGDDLKLTRKLDLLIFFITDGPQLPMQTVLQKVTVRFMALQYIDQWMELYR